MGYVYEIRFEIPPEKLGQLRIGEALETGLGYLRALLPSEPGYINARAYYSIDSPEVVHVIFQSMWDLWEDLVRHRTQSYLDEDHLLVRFKPHVEVENLRTHIFEEIP